MTGRLAWIEDRHIAALEQVYALQPPHAVTAVIKSWHASPPDPVAAFMEATRDRWVFGDAEWATETIARGLRALGRP